MLRHRDVDAAVLIRDPHWQQLSGATGALDRGRRSKLDSAIQPSPHKHLVGVNTMRSRNRGHRRSKNQRLLHNPPPLLTLRRFRLPLPTSPTTLTTATELHITRLSEHRPPSPQGENVYFQPSRLHGQNRMLTIQPAISPAIPIKQQRSFRPRRGQRGTQENHPASIHHNPVTGSE